MRYDIYRPIHKALRRALSELLVTLGSTDFSDEPASAAAIAALRRQLALSASHLAHEDRFIHPLLEERASGASNSLEDDHRHHDQVFAELEALAAAIEAAAPGERPGLGHALYLRFSRFVADDLAHMAEEETLTLPLLQLAFSDAELLEMEGRIVASHAPEKLIETLRLMMPALNRRERVEFLAMARASAPPEAFEAMLNFAAKPSLGADDWRHLADGLGLAA